MEANYYQTTRRNRDQLREEINKTKDEPAQFNGLLAPANLDGVDGTELYRRGVDTWTKIGLATIVVVADEIGWDTYINLLDQFQRSSIKQSALQLKEAAGLKGQSLIDAHLVLCDWSKGCGFFPLRTLRISKVEIEEYSPSCFQITALNEMGMGENAHNIHRWCDAYDNLIIQAVNPDAYYSHIWCLGKGDQGCRYYGSEITEDQKGSDFYQTNRGLMESRSSEILGASPDVPPIQGYMSIPAWTEDLDDYTLALDGIEVKGRIAHDNMLVSVYSMGWEKFLNLVHEKQSWGFTKSAFEMRADFDVQGASLQDAANLATIGYKMLGFSGHQLVEYTPSSIEGISTQCPIIDSAKHLGMEKVTEEFSLWCDFFHNFQVQVVNPDFKLTHTHCLGAGDPYCRFFIR